PLMIPFQKSDGGATPGRARILRFAIYASAALLCCAATSAQKPVGKSAAPVSYRKQIAPVFAASCAACHGAQLAQSGLSLATYSALMKGGKRGKPVIPGNASDSLIVQYIEGRKQPRMPVGGSLKPAEIALIRQWIAEGAKTDGEAPVAATAAPPIPLRVPVLPQAASLAWSRDGAKLAVGTYRDVK